MILSVWRYAHLSLAILSSVFLLILSVTGVILAVDALYEQQPGYSTKELDNMSLAQAITGLRESYPEITELSVNYNKLVRIDAFDADGNSVQGFIDPTTGELIGQEKPKSAVVQWTTALHRSLFLKETGRIIVGVASFLLLLISISGLVLILKRQKGIRHFFAKVHQDFFSQYFHVVSGRLLLIPVMILAITGTYLFLVRAGIPYNTPTVVDQALLLEDEDKLDVAEISVFQETTLSDIQKLEFPFDPDDPEENYLLTLKDRKLSVNQYTGQVVQEEKYPYTAVLDTLSLDLHTGRTNRLWALILGVASLNILFFIYTGFVITFRRTRTRIKNRYRADQAEIVLLFGSENGNTLFFADKVHKQLLADGRMSFLDSMNHYQHYPCATHLLVFTSTYGLGDAPSNADKFDMLLERHAQNQNILFSVIGFGSRSYADFCAFAERVDALLEKQDWVSRLMDMHTVNDRSAEQFASWTQQWTEKSGIPLATAPSVYQAKPPVLKKLKVVSKTAISPENQVFKLQLKALSGAKFQSGDLLAIYPEENKERFYSIGRHDGTVQLVVKLLENGVGSGFLYTIQPGETIQARIMANPNFHFPKKAKAVALIANGTGIAPFLGMIRDNRKRVPIHLYAGFRYRNEMSEQYAEFAKLEITKKRLKSCYWAFSREEEKKYVLDLIRRDELFFCTLLRDGGTVMICGALAMQRDVEQILDGFLSVENGLGLDFYKKNKQVLTDCY